MKRYLCLCAAPAMAAVSAFAQAPVVNPGGVVPAATFAPSGLINSGIAPGSFFTIFGTGLGPATPASPTTALYPTSLAGTSVTFTVGGTATPALVYFVSQYQVNGVLPSTVGAGTASVTVTTAAGTSAAQTAIVSTNNFGFLTRGGTGTGPALVQSYPSYSLNALNASAKPGDVLIFYGTGLAASKAGDQVPDTGGTGGLQTDLRSGLDFHMYVGNVEVSSGVGYAGLSPYAGLDQINLTLPSGTPTGCYVPVAIRVGNVASNFPSISINPNGGTCSDPYGLTSSQIDSAISGNLDVASLLLTRLSLTATIGTLSLSGVTEDTADAHFYQFQSPYSTPLNMPDFIGISSFGSCAVTSCSNTSTCIPTSQTSALPKLDAGSSLTVTGGNHTATVPKNSNGVYQANLGSSPIPLTGFPEVNFLAPGTFTFSGPGGSDINAFSASVTVPSAPTATYSPAVNASTPLDRSQNLTVTWTPGASGTYELIAITSATNVGTVPSGQTDSATLTCLPLSSAGTFTIPSWLLEALPASSTVMFSGLTEPGGAVLAGNFSLSNSFTSNAALSLANSLVLTGANITVK